MAFKPYMTSNDIIEAVKRRISLPISQNTFSELDILRFANEEMFISQVPSVLLYHEEFFVYNFVTPLQTDNSRYPIPDRAIGMRLRDVNWSDVSGNLFEMARINADDKAYFQRSIGANQAIHKFYLEGNDVVLTPTIVGSPTGSLNMYMFLRPNQLVKNDRAATITNFLNKITINNSFLHANDKITIDGVDFVAVSGSPSGNQFQIGASSSATAANLSNSINNSGLNVQASVLSNVITLSFQSLSNSQNIVPSNVNAFVVLNSMNIEFLSQYFQDGDIVTINNVPYSASSSTSSINQFKFDVNNSSITAESFAQMINNSGSGLQAFLPNPSGNIVTLLGVTNITVSNSQPFLFLPSFQMIQFDSVSPTWLNPETNRSEPLFVNEALIDFLQTKPGHRIRKFDVEIPVNGISGNVITFNASDVPSDLVVGDYICLANESIIPYLPPDLHIVLVEKTCARILAALGDQQGLATTTQTIAEMEKNQGTLIVDRVEGAPEKVLARHSLLRYGKNSLRRRY